MALRRPFKLHQILDYRMKSAEEGVYRTEEGVYRTEEGVYKILRKFKFDYDYEFCYFSPRFLLPCTSF